jgi:hypothetical protein
VTRPAFIPGPATSIQRFASAIAEGDLQGAERWATLTFAVIEAERVALELEAETEEADA